MIHPCFLFHTRFWPYGVALIECLQRAVSSIATMSKKINHWSHPLKTMGSSLKWLPHCQYGYVIMRYSCCFTKCLVAVAEAAPHLSGWMRSDSTHQIYMKSNWGRKSMKILLLKRLVFCKHSANKNEDFFSEFLTKKQTHLVLTPRLEAIFQCQACHA